jgi:hypothetical protein
MTWFLDMVVLLLLLHLSLQPNISCLCSTSMQIALPVLPVSLTSLPHKVPSLLPTLFRPQVPRSRCGSAAQLAVVSWIHWLGRVFPCRFFAGTAILHDSLAGSLGVCFLVGHTEGMVLDLGPYMSSCFCYLELFLQSCLIVLQSSTDCTCMHAYTCHSFCCFLIRDTWSYK